MFNPKYMCMESDKFANDFREERTINVKVNPDYPPKCDSFKSE